MVWRNRPLDRIYAMVLIDCIAVKVRDSQVANRPVYVGDRLKAGMDGEREILGFV